MNASDTRARRPAKRIKGWQPPPPTAPYCARRQACDFGTCCYPRPFDSQTPQPPR